MPGNKPDQGDERLYMNICETLKVKKDTGRWVDVHVTADRVYTVRCMDIYVTADRVHTV